MAQDRATRTTDDDAFISAAEELHHRPTTTILPLALCEMKINGCESSVGIGQLLAVVVLAVVMVVVVNTEFVDYFLFIWTFTRSQGAVAGKSLLMSEL